MNPRLIPTFLVSLWLILAFYTVATTFQSDLDGDLFWKALLLTTGIALLIYLDAKKF